jgi:uncharacterized protein
MKASTAKNNCFVIPVCSDFLLYAPLSKLSALINRAAARELKEQFAIPSRNTGNNKSEISTVALDIIDNNTRAPRKNTGSLNPKFLGIIPTRSCNASCLYCDFGSEGGKTVRMPYRLAAGAVDWYAGLMETRKQKILEIHFFGGEPMMARDVIEVALHRARLLAHEKQMITIFEISTNGQYKASDAKFIGEYFNKVILSLDGFREIQDKHRPLKASTDSFENSFETAKILSDSDATLCIRCCVSHLNISMMEEYTGWLCRNFRLSAINFETLSASGKSASARLYPPDPVEFAINFYKSRQIASRYGVDVVFSSDITSNPTISSCPVGTDTAIISPDGRISSCYLMPGRWQEAGLDLDFGFLGKDGKARLDKVKIDSIRGIVEDKPRCVSCFCRWNCAGGCHVGNTYPGSGLQVSSYCIQTRIISALGLLSRLEANDRIGKLLRSREALERIGNTMSFLIQDMDRRLIPINNQ